MTKEDVEQIRIMGELDGEVFLEMLLHRDGTVNRKGTDIDSKKDEAMVIGMTDGLAFRELLSVLDEKLLTVGEDSFMYEYPDKTGVPLEYTVYFLGEKPKIKFYKFKLATETKEVGEVFPYFYYFITKGVELTERFYHRVDKSKDIV